MTVNTVQRETCTFGSGGMPNYSGGANCAIFSGDAMHSGVKRNGGARSAAPRPVAT
jgi:hypothetical protein